MSKMRIQQITAVDDIKPFVYKGVEADYIKSADEARRHLSWLIENGRSWVGTYGGRIVGFGGIVGVDEGVYEAWLYANSDDMAKYLKTIVVFCRSVALKALTDWGYRRLQCRCLAQERKAVKFIEAIGFKREGLLRKALRGNDCYIYSIVKEDLVCPC